MTFALLLLLAQATNEPCGTNHTCQDVKVIGTVTTVGGAAGRTPVDIIDGGILQQQLADILTQLALIKAKTDNLDALLSSRTKPADNQNVTGSLTCNAGTNLNTSLVCLEATQTNGTAKAIARGGAKGATTAADVTSTANGADHQGLDVQIQNASITVTGTFWQTTQPVSGTVTCNAGTGTLAVSLASTTITGTVAATQSGTWSDRIVGNAGAAFDAANNAAPPANVLVQGFEAAAQGTTQPTAATAGNARRGTVDVAGVQYVHPHGPVSWSCFVQAVTVTTQCRAAPAAGVRAYVTTAVCDNQAATVQGVDVVFGTGANCVTGITALTHKFQMGTNATTTSPDHVQAYFSTPLVPTAANAICVRPTAATAFGCTLTGYDAP